MLQKYLKYLSIVAVLLSSAVGHLDAFPSQDILNQHDTSSEIIEEAAQGQLRADHDRHSKITPSSRHHKNPSRVWDIIDVEEEEEDETSKRHTEISGYLAAFYYTSPLGLLNSSLSYCRHFSYTSIYGSLNILFQVFRI